MDDPNYNAPQDSPDRVGLSEAQQNYNPKPTPGSTSNNLEEPRQSDLELIVENMYVTSVENTITALNAYILREFEELIDNTEFLPEKFSKFLKTAAQRKYGGQL